MWMITCSKQSILVCETCQVVFDGASHHLVHWGLLFVKTKSLLNENREMILRSGEIVLWLGC